MNRKNIKETTTSGSIASVSSPIGKPLTRAGSLFKGKKTKKKFFENSPPFTTKQQLIDYFISKGKTAAEASAAWERGYRGPLPKEEKPTDKKPTRLPREHWLDRQEREREEREEELERLRNLGENELVETDLILLPGQIKQRDRGFKQHQTKDHEISMASNELISAVKNAKRILDKIKTRSENKGLMAWQQSYITLSSDYLNSVADSLETDNNMLEMTGGVIAGGMSNFEESRLFDPKTFHEMSVLEAIKQIGKEHRLLHSEYRANPEFFDDYARRNLVAINSMLYQLTDFIMEKIRNTDGNTNPSNSNIREGMAKGTKAKPNTDWHGSKNDLDWYQLYKMNPVKVKVKNTSGIGGAPSGTFIVKSFTKTSKSDAEFTIVYQNETMHASLDLDNPPTYVDKNYDRKPLFKFYSGNMPISARQAFNLIQIKKNDKQGVAEGVTEAVWDRPSKSYVPRDGKTFGQTNHPREEHCDACGAATGHAGPGEGSNVDDNGNVYCDDCYSDKQSLGEGSYRDMETEIKAEIRKSEKMKNATRLYYYIWLLSTPNLHAATSYEIFINSWAGIQWFKKHKNEIQAFADEQNRRFQKNYKVQQPNQGVAEGFPHDVDHMPGKTIKHTSSNCTTCHGRKSMYKVDGKLFPDNKQGATKVKCPTCKGTGDKQGVAEGITGGLAGATLGGVIGKTPSAIMTGYKLGNAAQDIAAQNINELLDTSKRGSGDDDGDDNKRKDLKMMELIIKKCIELKTSKYKRSEAIKMLYRDNNLLKQIKQIDQTVDSYKLLNMFDAAIQVAKQWDKLEESGCPHCGGKVVSEELLNEKKDACYYKVKSRYKVWPSAYASGALVKCRKKGASNWGKSKANEDRRAEPRKPISPGKRGEKPITSRNLMAMGLEALIDEYVILQGKKDFELDKGNVQRADHIMMQMDELEMAIKRKKGGIEKFEEYLAWYKQDSPDDGTEK